MEAVDSPFSSLPIPSSLLHKPPTQQRTTHIHFITKHSQSRLRAQALNNAVTIATNAPAPHGDISVLIPVSAVLLFMYWISNFVVPEIVRKDLQRKAAEGEDEAEQTNAFQNRNDDEASAPSEPLKKKKIKKADFINMLKQRKMGNFTQ